MKKSELDKLTEEEKEALSARIQTEMGVVIRTLDEFLLSEHKATHPQAKMRGLLFLAAMEMLADGGDRDAFLPLCAEQWERALRAIRIAKTTRMQ